MIRHGFAGNGTRGRRSFEYITWTGIKQRCTNPAAFGFARYGGRGIRVCERWQVFENFLADMGTRPDGMTIDRIDNDGNYEPGNCRWATTEQQASSRSTTRLTHDLAMEIHGRIEHGESHESVANRLGITRVHVTNVRNGKRWRSAFLA